jgi:hypothetical protein
MIFLNIFLNLGKEEFKKTYDYKKHNTPEIYLS